MVFALTPGVGGRTREAWNERNTKNTRTELTDRALCPELGQDSVTLITQAATGARFA